MKNNQSVSQSLGRRRTLQVLGASLAVGGLFGAAGCKQNQGSEGDTKSSGNKAKDCTSSLDEAAKTQRRTLQYVDKAAVPEKNCAACAQFVPGQFADCGGGCKVLPGPVKPEGGCLAFAPKAGAPAANP